MVWILLGALVVLLAGSDRLLRRRWSRDPAGPLESRAPGVSGLGEAPVGVHHRMGPSARVRMARR
jgi:hypothetical protein